MLLKLVLLGSINEKTATLSVVNGQRTSTFPLSFENPSRHHLTNCCSCSRIFFIPPMEVMYSIAFARLTAQMIFGVHASNLLALFAKVCHSILTSSIVHPPRMIGTNVLIQSFFKYTTQIPVYAIILCHVKTRQSHPISCTSTGKLGTDCEPSTRKKVSSRSLDFIFFTS